MIATGTHADELLVRLRRAGVAIEARDDRIIWSAPAGVMTPALLEELARAKPELLEYLREGDWEWMPLAPAQERLYVLERLRPGRSDLNVPAVARLRGEVDESALRLALSALVARHDALRMVFDVRGGIAVQRSLPTADVPLEIRRVAGEDEAMRLVTEEAQRPFNLLEAPTLRALVVGYADSKWLIQLTFHHLSCDEFSLRLALGEVLALYAHHALGQPPGLAGPPRPYREYVLGELARAGDFEEDLRFWRKHLASLAEAPPAACDGPAYAAAIDVPGDALAALRRLAQAERSTLTGVVMAAFVLTLQGPLARDDIVIGVPYDGRGAAYDATVGTFVNTLAIRSRTRGAATFRELLRAVGRDLIAALDHAAVPYHRVVDAVRPGRGLTELFDAWLVLREVPPGLSVKGLSLARVEVGQIVAKHLLKLDLEHSSEGLRGTLLGRSPTWEPSTVDRMAAETSATLTMVAAMADRRLPDLRLAIRSAAEHLLSRRRDEVAESARSRLRLTRRLRG